MSFEPKKFNDIYEDMRKRTSIVTDFEVGSVARTLYESFAYEIALLYEKMQLVYLSAYVDSAQEQELDKVVAILGTERGLPDFAEGVVTFLRDPGPEDIQIPINLLVATEDKPGSPKKTYQTIEMTIFPKDRPSVDVKVKAVQRGDDQVTAAETLIVMPRPIPGIKSVVNRQGTIFVGKRRETDEELRERAKNELISSGKATVVSIENALLSMPEVNDVKVKEDLDNRLGVVEIVVDAPKFDDPEVKQRIKDEINRVRAAGILPDLKTAVPVTVNGVFKVEINPELKLSKKDPQRVQREKAVQDEIIKYIEGLRMGQALLFPQVMKTILSLDGMNNLEDFVITTSKPKNPDQPSGDQIAETYDSSKKQINIEEMERFKPGRICVASEIKELPVNIEFKVDKLDEDDKYENILKCLDLYFKTLDSNLKEIDLIDMKTKVKSAINDSSLDENTLKLQPQPWCQQAVPADAQTFPVSFVERVCRGRVFAYSKDLKITGALQLVLPSSIKDQEKQEIRTTVKTKIEEYLADLDMEADVVFADLIKIASSVSPVAAAFVDASDFRVNLEDTAANDRVSKDKIEVKAFEKVQLDSFCITSDIERVTIEVTTLILEMVVFDPPPSGFDQNAVTTIIKQAVTTAVNTFLAMAKPGQNVIYKNFKDAIENLVEGVTYSVITFDLEATSTCDNRKKVTTILSGQDIHIRSMEIAIIEPIVTVDMVNITNKVIKIPNPEGTG